MVREDKNGAAETGESVAADERPNSGQDRGKPKGKPEPRRSFFSRLRRYTPDPLSVDSSEAINVTAASPVADLNDDSFFDALNECITVVDFWASWCAPCKTLQPRFDSLARAHAGNPRLQFVRVNVDDSPGVASAFDVMSIPTLVVFDQTGREIDREVGLPGKRRLAQLAKGANSATDSLNERSER
jgi:thioredoxin 1